MRTICKKCYNNSYGNCYEGKSQYMKVYSEDDCNTFLENDLRMKIVGLWMKIWDLVKMNLIIKYLPS